MTAGAEDQCGWIQHIGIFCIGKSFVFAVSSMPAPRGAPAFMPARGAQSAAVSTDRCCISAAQRCRSRTRMCTCCSICRIPTRTARSHSHLGTHLQLHCSASAPPQILVNAHEGSPHHHHDNFSCRRSGSVPSMQTAVARSLRWSQAFWHVLDTSADGSETITKPEGSPTLDFPLLYFCVRLLR